MKSFMFLLCFLFLTFSYAIGNEKEVWFNFSENIKIIYADLNGNNIKEKIVFKRADEGEKSRTYIIIYENDSKTFNYLLEKLPINYIKTVNFKGTREGESRDILFLMVGECSSWLHSISYDRQATTDGPKASSRYVVKEFIVQVGSCY